MIARMHSWNISYHPVELLIWGRPLEGAMTKYCFSHPFAEFTRVSEFTEKTRHLLLNCPQGRQFKNPQRPAGNFCYWVLKNLLMMGVKPSQSPMTTSVRRPW